MISEIEGHGAHDLRLTTALRLVHPLGASIDQLTERIYWNPGQVIRNSQHPPNERLSGFFLILASNMPIFEPAPPREPVTTREEGCRNLRGECPQRSRARTYDPASARACRWPEQGWSLPD
ncbi:MAG TPA: hypothetical protein VLX28_13445 [Thermoanaerobaculia bacterium]|nr:hypothetical protein [Thermoanaerobaculia bacterium]